MKKVNREEEYKQYKIKARLTVDVEFDLLDCYKPTKDTIRYVVEEDLKEAGYDDVDVVVRKAEIKEIEE